jgi:hypothetical protein
MRIPILRTESIDAILTDYQVPLEPLVPPPGD